MNATELLAFGALRTPANRSRASRCASSWGHFLRGIDLAGWTRAPETKPPGTSGGGPFANLRLLDATHDAICVRYLNGVIAYWNRAAESLYGWTADAAIGRVGHALLKTILPVPLDQIEAQVLRIGFWEGELVHALKDGTRVTVASRWSVLLDEASAPIAILDASIDITDRKRAQAERLTLEHRLGQSERMEAIGLFASGIAHDFNNVLGTIIPFAEVLFRDAPANSAVKERAHTVLTAALRGRHLADQILAYGSNQRGERTPTDMCRIASETLKIVGSSLPAYVSLHATIPQLPLTVIGDATQLHQVVMNLCTNAIHAMKAGGRLCVAVSALDIDAGRAPSQSTLSPGRHVRLSVEDSGCGMDEATRARIFEPFFTTRKSGRGTGLGLALVHDIVTDLGGAIEVESAPGAGSTFSIYLPMADASEAPVGRG